MQQVLIILFLVFLPFQADALTKCARLTRTVSVHAEGNCYVDVGLQGYCNSVSTRCMSHAIYQDISFLALLASTNEADLDPPVRRLIRHCIASATQTVQGSLSPAQIRSSCSHYNGYEIRYKYTDITECSCHHAGTRIMEVD